VLTLGVMLEALSGAPYEQARQVITEATVDSRLVIPGSLFVALPGERVDGHDFVADAFQRGAQFALVQRDLSAQYPMIDLHAGEMPEHRPWSAWKAQLVCG
jgi:UDP-N-acetylmuramoyl-tripeptide--D-alanyl-D-alanine ligase